MRRRLTISGKVQGVWYRDWFVGEAKALALTGWVRNRDDGTVEAVVDGPEAAVTAMIARAARGSPASRVDRVEARDEAGDERFDGFARRPGG